MLSGEAFGHLKSSANILWNLPNFFKKKSSAKRFAPEVGGGGRGVRGFRIGWYIRLSMIS